MTKKLDKGDVLAIVAIQEGSKITRALLQAMMANPIAAVTGTFVITEILEKLGIFSKEVALTVESLSVGAAAATTISRLIPKLQSGDIASFPDTLTIINQDGGHLPVLPGDVKK